MSLRTHQDHYPPLFIAAILGGSGCLLNAQTLVAFDDLSLSVPPATAHAEGGVYYNGSDGAGGFTSHGVYFENNYNSTFGSWSGWAYSTVGNTTTPGWDNQYASFAGGGQGDSTFAIGYTGFGLSLDLPAAANLHSVFLSNGTYPGLSMSLGDDFAKKFGGADGSEADYFLLTMTGKNASGDTTGVVEFFLADFRAADSAADYVIDTWTEVDLTGLGSGVRHIEFALSSSDNGDFGMNTPAYFVIDSLRFTTAIPEAEMMPFFLGVVAALLTGRRRRK